MKKIGFLVFSCIFLLSIFQMGLNQGFIFQNTTKAHDNKSSINSYSDLTSLGTTVNTDSVKLQPNNNIQQMIQKLVATSNQWTILVYMDGDNNLEQAAIDDLNEMESVDGLSSSVNIIVQVDRIDGYDTSNGDWTGARRYKVTHDTNINTISSTKLQELGEINMGDPATLQTFMEWGLTTYPANHYALILWDHGGGVEGVAWDDSNNNDHLTLEELGSTFEKVYSAKKITFDIIGFDACLMATIEVVNQVKDYAKYIVASEEVEPGDGWPYDRFLGKLSKTPSMDGQQLATIIVSEYGVDYESRKSVDTTLSAIKTDRVQSIVNGLNSLAGQLDTIVTNEKGSDTFTKTRLIEKAINSAQKYQLDNQIDLGGFLKSLKDSNSFDTVSLTSLLDNYTNSVLKNYFGSARSGSTGLTVHTNPNDYPAGIVIVKNTNWDDFLVSYYSSLSSANNINYSPPSASSGADLYGNFTEINPVYPIIGSSTNVTFIVVNKGTIASQTYNVSFYEFKEGEKESATFLGTVLYSSLASGYQRTDIFVWTPTASGERSLLLFIETSNDINEGNNLDSFKAWIKPSVGSPAAFIWLDEENECFVENGGYGCTGKIYYEIDNFGGATIPANELNVTILAESVEFNFTEIVDSFTYNFEFTTFTYYADSSSYVPTKGGNFNFYIIVDYSLDPVKEDDWATVSTYVYSLQTDLAINILDTDPAFEGYSSNVNVEIFNKGITDPSSDSAAYLFDYIYYNDTWVSADSYYLSGLVTNILDTSGWYSTTTFTWTPELGGLHLLLAWVVENFTDPDFDNDPFDFNDFSYFIVYVYPDAPDLSVEQFFIEDAAGYIVGTEYTLGMEIYNLGLQDANDYELNIYDYTVATDDYRLAVADTDSIPYFEFVDYTAPWTPTSSGDHILVIEVFHSGDYINETNYAYISLFVNPGPQNTQTPTSTETFDSSLTDSLTEELPGFEFGLSLFVFIFIIGLVKLRRTKRNEKIR
jgi:hypothetical protein